MENDPVRSAIEELERLSVLERQRLVEKYAEDLVRLASAVLPIGRKDLHPLLSELGQSLKVASEGIAVDGLGIEVLIQAGCLIASVESILASETRLRLVGR